MTPITRTPATALQYLHLVAALQRFSETFADVAAAGEHDAFEGLIQLAQLAHDNTDIFTCCDEEHFIIGLDDTCTFGNDRFATTVAPGHPFDNALPDCPLVPAL